MAGLYLSRLPVSHCLPLPHARLLTLASQDNPFGKRETHSSRSILTYKILTLLSWLLAVVVSVYYTVHEPHDGFTIRNRLWDQNYLYPSAFTMNHVLADIYWFVVAPRRDPLTVMGPAD